jgi:hypothetical protein
MLRIGQFIGPIYKWLPKSSSSYDTELAQKLPQICLYIHLKNSVIIHEENTKKNHKRVVSVYVIQIHVDLHKLKL